VEASLWPINTRTDDADWKDKPGLRLSGWKVAYGNHLRLGLATAAIQVAQCAGPPL